MEVPVGVAGLQLGSRLTGLFGSIRIRKPLLSGCCFEVQGGNDAVSDLITESLKRHGLIPRESAALKVEYWKEAGRYEFNLWNGDKLVETFSTKTIPCGEDPKNEICRLADKIYGSIRRHKAKGRL